MHKAIEIPCKKTGASFLVVYVIYVSIVYTDSKITASCLFPRHTIFATFGRQLKCLVVRIQGGLYQFHYVLDNMNWLLFVFLSNLTLLPIGGEGGGGFLAHTIRLEARTLEPFHLESPKFLTSFLYFFMLLDILWQNVR